MSLDVYLRGNVSDVECFCICCGNAHARKYQPEYFSWNITHNLGRMANEAGIYYALWRPDEIGVMVARDLVPLLRSGLDLLESNPAKFRALNPENGWGTYDGLVAFVHAYLNACVEYPTAEVFVSR